MNINLIKELRKQTGAPIAQCKDALEKCLFDIDGAKVYLRESGVKFLEKRKVVGYKPHGILRTTTVKDGVITTTEKLSYNKED